MIVGFYNIVMVNRFDLVVVVEYEGLNFDGSRFKREWEEIECLEFFWGVLLLIGIETGGVGGDIWSEEKIFIDGKCYVVCWWNYVIESEKRWWWWWKW